MEFFCFRSKGPGLGKGSGNGSFPWRKAVSFAHVGKPWVYKKSRSRKPATKLSVDDVLVPHTYIIWNSSKTFL
jgi:hypothetical protein